MSQFAPSFSTESSSIWLRAIRVALLPIVRILVTRQVAFQSFVELAKSMYVEVALKEFHAAASPSDSAVSLLTGIHRKEVKRLRVQETSTPYSPMSSPLVAVLNEWSSQKFSRPDGAPMELPRTRRAGGEQSFEALAESVNSDVRPRALLDQLLRIGVVTINDADRVAMFQHAVAHTLPEAERAEIASTRLQTLARATAHNILQPVGERKRFPILHVFSNEVTRDTAQSLVAFVGREIDRLNLRFNAKVNMAARRDSMKPNAKSRFSMVICAYGEDEQGTALSVVRPARTESSSNAASAITTASPATAALRTRARKSRTVS
jgi:Family of unknown function (DUF6502)